jgi:hypothetical protein
VGLEVDADDLAVAGQELEVRTEHVERAEATVQEDERFALAEDPVAEFDPADASQAAGALDSPIP